MKFEPKNVKVFVGGQELKGCTVDEITFDSDSSLDTQELLLTPGAQITKIVGTSLEMDQHVALLLQYCWFELLPSITPDGIVGRACVGVCVWRQLADWILPLHRRPSISGYWRNALAARYWVNTLDSNGKPTGGVRGFYCPGNQREVLEVYDRIRREAGDFEADELGGLN